MQLKKFKLSVDNFELVDKLDPSALQQGVDTDLTLNLQNYSNQDFQLNQLTSVHLKQVEFQLVTVFLFGVIVI